MEWKKIKGYEYEVSNIGEVKSLDREVPYRLKGYKQKIKGLLLKQNKKSNGYLHVTLFDRKGNPKYCSTHRLVALYFVENKKKYPQVNHIDGNKLNNHYLNLEWVTQSQNMMHFFKSEKFNPSHNTQRKLNKEQVLEIRSLQGKNSYSKLALKFNVRMSTIYSIMKRKTWKNI